MSLQNATTKQLLAWALDIMEELARRAAPPKPASATPPWERQEVPEASQMLTSLLRRAPQAEMIEPPRTVAPRVVEPGTVIATGRTDPELAARFAQVPARPDHPDNPLRSVAPPVQGNGKGEGGAIDFNPP